MNGAHDTSQRTARELWCYTGLLATAALLCGILLGGLSAWFLGSVALAGLSAAAYAFNFHIPAALIRFLAIGRTVARYGERLLGHKATLHEQTIRRTMLFANMAASPAVLRAGWQLADQARLADYLDDVEDVDFARLRAHLPTLLLAGGICSALIATGLIAPFALAPIGMVMILLFFMGRRLARVGAAKWSHARMLRRQGVQDFGAIMSSIVPLQGEGYWPAYCASAMGCFSKADDVSSRLRVDQIWFDALVAMSGPIAALSVFGAAYLGGARQDALLIPTFLSFSWLTLGEMAQGGSRMIVAALRRRVAKAEIDRWGDVTASPTTPRTRPSLELLTTLKNPALQRCAPDGRHIGKPLAMTLRMGCPTLLVGSSGAGKTSLLKQIAGWIGDDVMESDTKALAASDRRALSLFCLHDAAIIADTVRANLFAASRSDVELWQALEAVEMDHRIREAGGLDGWISQDVLSLGEAQRLNLARAWLTTKPLVLLDEPTEHLDIKQGRRILARLLARLTDRIVILSSHGVSTVSNANSLQL